MLLSNEIDCYCSRGHRRREWGSTQPTKKVVAKIQETQSYTRLQTV